MELRALQDSALALRQACIGMPMQKLPVADSEPMQVPEPKRCPLEAPRSSQRGGAISKTNNPSGQDVENEFV